MMQSDCSTSLSARKSGAALSPMAGYFLVLAAAIIFYAASCAPGLLWQDSGMFQYRIMQNDIKGNLGLALSHPLYIMLGIAGKSIPLGDVFHRINLISSLAAAFTVANLFLLIRLWLGSNFAAVVAAISLGVSHTFWQHGAIAEVYTLYTATFLAELVCFLQYCRTKDVKYLYLLGLFKGLSIANHMWAIIPQFCYDVFFLVLLIKREIKIRHFVVICVLWCVGASPYLYLIVQELASGAGLLETAHSVFFGKSFTAAVTNISLSLRVVKENVLYIGMNFPTPTALLAIAGLASLWRLASRKAFANIILALTILFLLFAFRYQVPDRYAFFLPFYCLVAILIGAGSYVLIKRFNGRVVKVIVLVLAMLPVGIYAVLPSMARIAGLKIGTKRQIPYRDDYEYFLQPWQSGYDGPERFASEAFDIAAENAAIYADSTIIHPLILFQQTRNVRPDVDVMGYLSGIVDVGSLETFLRRRVLYVVSPISGYCPSILLDNCVFEQRGVLYRVVLKDEAEQ